MTRLRLDDPRWAGLDARNGKSHWVPERIAHLLGHPEDDDAFGDLWPNLCSEGSSYSAGHAALPYVLDVAEARARGSRLEFLAFVGYLVVGTGAGVRPELRAAYEEALPRALQLVADELPFTHSAADTRHLVAAAVAIKGYPRIADVIQGLDCLTDCPECGAELEEIEG
jgi:hypothetical protein